MWNIINPSKASSLGHKLCKQLLLIPLIHVCWGFQHGVLRVQFSIVSVRSEKRICTSPRLSEVSTKCCLWNNSNVRLIDYDPLSFFQGRSSSASSFHASLLQAIDVLGFVSAGGVSSLSTLQIFREASHLLELLYPPVYLFGRFPSLPSRAGGLERGCRPLQYGLPIPLFTFCSKLIESVRMMACAARLSLLEANLRRA